MPNLTNIFEEYEIRAELAFIDFTHKLKIINYKQQFIHDLVNSNTLTNVLTSIDQLTDVSKNEKIKIKTFTLKFYNHGKNRIPTRTFSRKTTQ